MFEVLSKVEFILFLSAILMFLAVVCLQCYEVKRKWGLKKFMAKFGVRKKDCSMKLLRINKVEETYGFVCDNSIIALIRVEKEFSPVRCEILFVKEHEVIGEKTVQTTYERKGEIFTIEAFKDIEKVSIRKMFEIFENELLELSEVEKEIKDISDIVTNDPTIVKMVTSRKTELLKQKEKILRTIPCGELLSLGDDERVNTG